ncbi:MAG: cyclic nucleotide-binding domain-containing protein [Coraliomargarita sp.]|nr:cyclic nucleotide-binding domain-containing protein [Coraliomargarita sp.]
MKETLEFRPGASIIKQGDSSPGFFVLEKGSVEVFKDELMLSVLMFPGTVFGELSDILGKPRTCTIKARTPTIVTKYEVQDMEAIIKQHPDIALKIFKTLAGRLERTTQKLADLSRATMLWSEEDDPD